MRNILRKFDGEGTRILAMSVALATLAGCGGGGGSRGAGSTVAASTSGTSTGTLTAAQLAANLTALDIAPSGDIAIFGFGVGQATASAPQQQIIVDGFYKDSSQRDLTRVVSYTVADPTIAKISGEGLVTPLAVGETTVTVSQPGAGGQTLTVTRKIKVSAQPAGAAGVLATAVEIYPSPVRKLADIDPATSRDQFQQFVVVVRYADGTSEDVTRTLGLKVQDAATGGPTVAGRAATTGLFRGTDNGAVDVIADMSNLNLSATSRVILGTGNGNPLVPSYTGAPLAGSTNAFDVVALSALKSQKIEPSALTTDGEFLRRVTADTIGRLPTIAEFEAFVADKASDKRAKKIDELLAKPEFATHWAKDLIGPWAGVGGAQAAMFDTAVQTDLAADRSLSDIVKDLAAGVGPASVQFDAKFTATYDKVDHLMNTFTGYTSKCARCHDHPLTTAQDDPRWVQDDNYGLYAFLAMTPAEATKVNKAGQRFGTPIEPSFILDKAATGLPKLADPIATRRAKFGELLSTSKAFFRGTGHRIFAEVMRPLLDPNEFLQANLAGVTNPKMLDAITTVFTDQKASLKGFLRTLMTSKLYQLSSASKTTKNDDLLARSVIRRHHSEVLEQGVSSLAGVPYATDAFFAGNFGYPTARLTITERRDVVNQSQAFTLMNSPRSTNGKVIMPASSLTQLSADVTANKVTMEDAIKTLFRAALSRDPNASELSTFATEAKGAATAREALEDVAVALAASIEFSMR